ncbi:hypothetical protein [Geomonas azotofigens]|nr:hypothetical protein [Geomonas azotofigens]MBU5613175.1 hypothetical protein [Geomonas azotofigens]
MKINRSTRFCCVAVIVAGIAVVGHVAVRERGITPYHDATVKQAQDR